MYVRSAAGDGADAVGAGAFAPPAPQAEVPTIVITAIILFNIDTSGSGFSRTFLA
jgi:hypothetical protein